MVPGWVERMKAASSPLLALAFIIAGGCAGQLENSRDDEVIACGGAPAVPDAMTAIQVAQRHWTSLTAMYGGTNPSEADWQRTMVAEWVGDDVVLRQRAGRANVTLGGWVVGPPRLPGGQVGVPEGTANSAITWIAKCDGQVVAVGNRD